MVKLEPSANLAGERINWRASWIWAAVEAQPRNAYLYARKVFKLKDAPKTALLHCSADSRYRLFVNGEYVGQGPVPSTRGSMFFDSYEVSHLLKEGENCIAILVHHLGEGTYSYDPVRAGLICQVEADGEVIATDETWKVLPAADWTDEGWRISKRLGFQEVYDARLHPGDWQLEEFYDENWQEAVVIASANEEPWGKLLPREIPYLVEEEIAPRAVVGAYVCPPLPQQIRPSDMAWFMAKEELTPLPPRAAHNLDAIVKGRRRTPVIHPPRGAGGSIILDFGREVTGHIEFGFSGWGGAIVDIGYSERLDDGRVRPDMARMRYTDRYIMRSGQQRWRSMGQRAFRYMQLDFRETPRAVGIEYIHVIQATQPSGEGRFECSDKLLNEIWSTGAYTAHLAMQETFLGCPWRERAQWWSDARITSHVAYYTSGDISLLRQGIRQFAAAQNPDGSIPGICPAGINRLISDYSAFWILSVWEYYAWTQDKELLAELYPAVVRALDWFRQFARPDGLLADVRGDIFIDWAQIEKTGVVTALNCLYYEALHRTGQMAAALDKGEEAVQHELAASTVCYAINRYLWASDRGLYLDNRWNSSPDAFSAQTNIMAVLFDIPDHYRKAAICRQLLEPEWQEKLATPYFTSYFIEVLCRTGFYQEALDIIRKRWGDMLKAGATTFWERFTPDYSRCHAWASGPTRHLPAEFLGVRPLPDQRKVRIAPQPLDLKWAEGLVPTPYGNVEVAWKREKQRFTMRVTIPEGMSAEVIAPNGQAMDVWVDGEENRERLIRIGSGEHELRVQYATVRTPRQPKPPTKTQEEAGMVEVLPAGDYLRDERGGRRPRRRKPLPKAQAPPVAEPKAQAPIEEKTLETKPGKRRKKAVKATTEPQVQPVAEVPVPTEESTATTKAETIEAPKKPRRRPRSTKKTAEVKAQFRDVAPVSKPEPEPVETPPQAPPVPSEEGQPTTKARRRPTYRRRPRSKPAEQGEVSKKTGTDVEKSSQSD